METVTLEITREPWNVKIAGTCKDSDVILAALRQVTVYFEQQQLIGALDLHVQKQSLVGALTDGHGRKVSA